MQPWRSHPGITPQTKNDLTLKYIFFSFNYYSFWNQRWKLAEIVPNIQILCHTDWGLFMQKIFSLFFNLYSQLFEKKLTNSQNHLVFVVHKIVWKSCTEIQLKFQMDFGMLYEKRRTLSESKRREKRTPKHQLKFTNNHRRELSDISH